jgi:hypothetical protein
MTIEATLERIAAALESMARSANTPAAEPPQAPPGPTGPPPSPELPPENVAPRPRGRPRKAAEPVQAAPAAPKDDADEPEEQGGLDFLDDAVEAAASEPAEAVTKEYTIEEVRKALGELQTRVGTTRALALFKEVSGGAERLPQLAPEKFAAVFEAAEKMRK